MYFRINATIPSAFLFVYIHNFLRIVWNINGCLKFLLFSYRNLSQLVVVFVGTASLIFVLHLFLKQYPLFFYFNFCRRLFLHFQLDFWSQIDLLCLIPFSYSSISFLTFCFSSSYTSLVSQKSVHPPTDAALTMDDV